jgi:glycosyltransferase involved in cell wall biosynthesis
MSSASPTLSLVLPAYNEEALLDDCVRRLHAALAALHVSAEIIIVNDGSRDTTPLLADALARELPGVVACHQQNQGIGGAFRTGVVRATGDYLILWPADMPAEPADLEPFTAQFGHADVIVGVRRARLGYNPLMRINSWLYPRLARVLFGLRLRDVNWIHAYRRTQFLRITLTQSGIPMLVEALVRLRDLGATFIEVDVAMKARVGGVPSASRFKVMWRTLTGLLVFWKRWREERRIRST